MKHLLFKTLKLIRCSKYGWSGDYSSWEAARATATGYDSQLILEKVKNALLKVKNGKAQYERDSMLFDEIEYSWPMLTALLWIASRNSNCLHIIDFGGSLGSSYFQNRRFLSHLTELSWNIVEQMNFVACGKEHFQDDVLRFYSSIEACLKSQRCDTILLSSVLPYIEKPYDLVVNIIALGFKNIIIDRTPFFLKDIPDRLTIQNVPPGIYRASYPAWFFNREKFLKLFQKQYDLVAEFTSNDKAPEIAAEFKGFIFKAKL
ncbi:MAG: methyltransferase, TIGR04325 family [Syntrophus sp. (in: bacteria)]|nr:methyltransferase, TIGR04325 family [Syntrophus sp. (in: bacteria)]